MAKISTFLSCILLLLLLFKVNAQNNALYFNGTNNYVAANSLSTALANSDALSMETWICPTTTSGQRYILSFHNAVDNRNILLFGIKDGTLNFCYNDGIDHSFSGTKPIPLNEWTHIALTISPENVVKVYFNGQLELTTTMLFPARPVASGKFTIGQDWDGMNATDFFGGQMDEIRIWNTVRTQEQICQNMFKELLGAEPGLVAYYNMNDGSGSTLSDNLGNLYNGTFQGSPQWRTSGVFAGARNALSFDGSNDYVLIPHHPSLNVSKLTMEMWMYWEKTVFTNGIEDVNFLISKGDNTLEIHTGPNHHLRFIPTPSVWLDTENNVFESQRWHHIAFVYDASATYAKCYIDGIERSLTDKGLNPLGTPIQQTLDNLKLGFRNGWVLNTFQGKLDEVRIWNTARSASEIRENMMKTLSGNEVGLVAYYRFDGANGLNLYDLSANGNHGILTNMSGTEWTKSDAFNTWLGVESSDWANAANWSDGIPAPTGNVGIYKTNLGNEATVSGTPTIANLLVSSTAAPILNSGLNVNGNLILNSNVDLAGQSVNLGSSAFLVEDEGHFYGSSGTVSTTRELSAVNNKNVGGLGAIITTTANMGSTTISRGHSVNSFGTDNSIQRYFDISPANNNGLDATLAFSYNESELNGNTEAGLELFRSEDSGTTWKNQNGTANITDNLVSLNGIASFSQWTLIEDTQAPTAEISYSPAGPYHAGDEVAMTVTFSEEMKDSPVPQITISGSNLLSATNLVKTSATVYTFNYIVAPGPGTCLVSLSAGTDLAGNIVAPTPTSGSGFVVENQAPIFSSTPVMTVNDNELYEYLAVANDHDGDVVSITGTTVPEWLTLTSVTGGAKLSGSAVGKAGTYPVSLKATDAHGGETIQSFTLTVNDVTPPVVLCKNFTLQLNSDGNGVLTTADIDNGSNDASGIKSMTVSPEAFGCSDVGNVSVELTVTDNYNHVSTCTATVTVEDNTAPIQSPIVVMLDENGTATVTEEQVRNSFSDACGIANSTVEGGNFSCGDVSPSSAIQFLSNGYLSVAGTSPLNFSRSTSFTLEAKIKPNAPGHLFSKRFERNGDFSMSIYIQSNGSLSFGIDEFTWGGWTTITSPAGVINFEEWSHVAFVYNYSNRLMQIFLDGVQVASGTLTKYPFPSNGAIFIGASRDGGSQFNGLMDEVRIWTTARTATQINANKNIEINPSSAGLAAYYTFNNGYGLQAVDASPTKRNATFAGGLTAEAWTGFVGRPLTVNITDTHGNTSTAAEVIVHDQISPEVRTKNTTVYLDENGSVTITPDMVDNGSTDNCSILQMALDKTTFNYTKLGDNAVTLTATDASGNQSSATAVVTVKDSIPPVITCPAEITVSNDPGRCDAVVSYAEVVTSDNSAVMGNVITNGDFEAGNLNGWTASGWYQMNDGTAEPFIFEMTPAISGNYDLLMEMSAQITSPLIHVPSNVGSAKVSWKDRIRNDYYFDDYNKFKVELLDEGLNVVHEIYSTRSGDPLIQLGPNAREFELTNVLKTLVNQNIYLRFSLNSWDFLDVNLDDINFEIKSLEAIQTAGLPSGSVFPVGTTTNTFEVTDAGGNTSTCSFDVTVEDDELPLPVAQDVTVYLDEFGEAFVSAEEVDNGSTDNCGIASLSLSKTNFTCADVGENEVVLTVTDVNNLSSTATATVTVVDQINPVAIAQNVTIYLDAEGNASVSAEDVDNGSTDNCGIASLSLSKTDFTCEDVGENEVVLTVTDVNNLSSTATATVTVVDQINPIAIAQNVTIYVDAEGNASITAEEIDNGSTDNCGIASRSLSKTNFTCEDVGENEVVLTVTDVNNRVGTATATVTVVDEISPVVVAKNITVQLDESGLAEITPEMADNGSSDNCNFELTVSQSSFNCSSATPDTEIPAVVERNYAGRTVTFSNVNINGTGKNTFAANPGSTVNISLNWQSQYTSDYCPGCVQQFYFGIKDIEITCLYSGNTSSNRSGTGSLSFTAPTDPGIYAIQFNSSLDFSCVLGSGSFSTNLDDALGYIVVGYPVSLIATDNSGNAAESTFFVTVADNLPPTVITRDLTVELDQNGSYVLDPMEINDGSSDNCSTVSFSLDKTTFGCEDIGQHEVVLTATDAAGNTSNSTATVTVADRTAPALHVKDISVQLDASGHATINTADLLVSVSDNCGVQDISLSRNSFNCADLFSPVPVEVAATDVNGNTAIRIATVTVLDRISPKAFCKDLTVYLDENGQAVIDGTMLDNGSYDNCNMHAPLLDKKTFDCSNLGENTVAMTLIDFSGNYGFCLSTVTVVDTVNPTINVVQDITVTAGAGATSATVEFKAPTATDNCGATVEQTQGLASGSEFPLGTTSITFVATDLSGNSAETSFTVTVKGSNAPKAIGKVDIIYVDKGATRLETLPQDLFNDPDPDDVLRYSLTTETGTVLPSWIRFNEAEMQVNLSPSATELGEHKFRLVATDPSGLSAWIELVVVVQNPTGVTDRGNSLKLLVYPNPTKGLVYISVENSTGGEMEISVHTMVGQEIHRKFYKMDETAEIDLSTYVNGTYLVRIKSGTTETIRKVILTR